MRASAPRDLDGAARRDVDLRVAQRDAGELARRPSAVRTRYYNDAIRDAAFARPAFLDDL